MDELKSYLQPLYKKNTPELEKKLLELYKSTPKIDSVNPNPHWYKFINLYFIYPDSITSKQHTPLRNLRLHLEYVKNLGCNALHILPFLESPMVDRGFDISNFYTVRKELGTLEDVKALGEKAKQLGIHLFMDLVFNHVSDHHEWFKKAESGDETYRKYFIYSKTKPQFVRKFHKESAVWAEYIVNGEKKEINIAFPEYVGEIPHWRQGKDGYWYYHTYYPDQVDVNWKNPDVFYEFTKILMFWASLGFNFRLDAIPFVGKSAYKETDSYSTHTYSITAALNYIAGAINPECVFIVETYERVDTIVNYFGTVNTKQAQLAYNFHLCTALWVSVVKQDTRYVWEKLQDLAKIPSHGEWLNFLRNHDELSLAYLPDNILKEVQDAVLKHGEPFREGYGVSGRTLSLLGNDEKRFLMSYFLVASMPGGVVVPYGDEVGMKNIPLDQLRDHEKRDTRNINRGLLLKKAIYSQKGKRIYQTLAKILHDRQVFRDYLNIWPEKIMDHKNVFTAVYRVGTSELIILVNMSDKTHKVTLASNYYKTVSKVNGVRIHNNNEVILSAYAGIWLQK